MTMLAQGAVTTVPLMLQLGVGGIFAILILRLVFDFVEKRETKRNSSPGVPPSWAVEALGLIKRTVERMSVMAQQIDDLHDWHKPENGVQEWKNKAMIDLMREFKEAMEHASERSSKAIENNNALIERMIPIVSAAEKKM